LEKLIINYNLLGLPSCIISFLTQLDRKLSVQEHGLSLIRVESDKIELAQTLAIQKQLHLLGCNMTDSIPFCHPSRQYSNSLKPSGANPRMSTVTYM